MDKHRYVCEVCRTEVELINKESHENGKKHVRNLKTFKRIGRNKIIVTNFPSYVQADDLLKVFSQFGHVKVERVARGFAVLQLKDERACQAAIDMQGTIMIYGGSVLIRYFKPSDNAEQNVEQGKKRDFGRSKQKEMIIKPTDINLSGGFDEQSQAILSAIRLTREQVEAISLLYSNLTEVFQCLWPGCAAIPFGSITTGLGITTSDADCFVDIPPQFWREGRYVHKAKKFLLRYPNVFSEVLAIPQANTPIIKFFHVPTDINCDVSFKTPLGTRNSALIAYMLRADQRILFLCILIKYWAKVHGLTGTGRVSNYALTMLVIFYLQQEPDPWLPSVELLQRGQNYIVDTWNTGFNDQFPLSAYVTDKPLSHLLGGFFQFYRSFNFKEDIVCPYLGVPIKKESFERTEEVSDDFELYKANVANESALPLKLHMEMCIQDPFEHSRNIAASVGFKLFHEIIQFIQWAADIYEKDTPYDCRNFLRNILLQRPKIRPIHINARYKVIVSPQILSALPEDEWKDMVVDAFHKIFGDILRFSITRKEPGDGQPTNKGYKEYYQCKATNLVWRRKKVTVVYDSSKMDFLTKQIALTDDILSCGSGKAHVRMEVLAELLFFHDQRKCHMFVKWEKDENNHFEEFTQFCMINLHLWFVEILKMHIDKDTGERKSEPKPGTSVGERAQENMMCHEPAACGSRTNTKSQDIPKPKSEFRDLHDFSPDTNPPMKMFKKD